VIQPRALFKVVVNGVDYTSRFDPVLKSITVSDSKGTKSDTANIVVADPNGQTYLPEPKAKVQISLGHEGQGIGLVFRGEVDSVSCSVTKGGGRDIKISCKGLDTRGKAKQPAERSAEDKTFGDVAQDWGQRAGFSAVRVSPGLQSVQRPYWSMQNESFIHWGERIAREIGATFRISDNEAIFVEEDAQQSASGKTLPTVTATYGQNLISAQVDPYSGRSQFQETRVRFYDRQQARFREEVVQVPEASGTSARSLRTESAGSQATAQQTARTKGKKSKRKKGSGSVVILGDSRARPEGMLNIVGVRPGVDGAYKIQSITHKYEKGSGYTTSISCGDPGNGAGKDGRRRRGR
jgi:phage protein D